MHLSAATPDDIGSVRALFREYAASLPFSLCFQGFEDELATLPGKYAAPAGRLLLAFDGPERAPVGCIALRPLQAGICEMKRLFVRPSHRSRGLGRLLCQRLIEEARVAGYRTMRLDTSADMIPAQRLYASLGFRPIPRYNDDPLEDTIFMELNL
jgi:GNAT superfamily N-acetyltransferase